MVITVMKLADQIVLVGLAIDIMDLVKWYDLIIHNMHI
jgi:DNA polymerase III epsilon subunit-like protein